MTGQKHPPSGCPCALARGPGTATLAGTREWLGAQALPVSLPSSGACCTWRQTRVVCPVRRSARSPTAKAGGFEYMTVQVRQEMRASGVGLVARRRGAPFVSVLRERDPGTCEVSPWLLLLKGPTPCPGRALLSFCLGPNSSLVVVRLRSLDADQGRGEPCSTLEPVSHSAVTLMSAGGGRGWGSLKSALSSSGRTGTLADDYRSADLRVPTGRPSLYGPLWPWPAPASCPVSCTRPRGHRYRKGSSQLTL